MKTKYLFDHVEKTAGTSLRFVFESLLGTENVLSQPMTGHTPACSEFHACPMIMGHFRFFPGEQLDPSRSYITILRHPIDRAISHFSFLQQEQALVQAGHARFARSKTFNEYLRSSDSLALEFISNFQVRHYLQLEWDGKSLLSETDELELAIKALNRYALVGVYEYLGDFVDVFCYEEGYPPIREIPRVKVTLKRPRPEEIDVGLRERLQEMNWADMELWRYATNLFLERKRQMMIECIEARATGCLQRTHSFRQYAELSQTSSTPEDLVENTTGGHAPLAEFGTRAIEITDVQVLGELSGASALFCGENATLRIIFRANQESDDLTVGILIRDSRGRAIYGTNTVHHMYRLTVLRGGEYYVDYKFKNSLGEDSYTVNVNLHRGAYDLLECYHWRDSAASFSVEGNLGYHFHGTTDLNPLIAYGVIEGDPHGIGASELVPGGLPPVRFTRDTPVLTEFSADMCVLSVMDFMLPLEIVCIDVEITNTSSEVWHEGGLRPVRLSYHWTDGQGNTVDYDGLRTRLPRDISPAETFRVLATVRAPEVEGTLLLQFTLLQESVAWFDEQGVSPETIQVRIGRTEIQ